MVKITVAVFKRLVNERFSADLNKESVKLKKYKQQQILKT